MALCRDTSVQNCLHCNKGAGLPAKTQRIIQSEPYQKLKNTAFFTSAKKRMAGRQPHTAREEEKSVSCRQTAQEFQELRQYYCDIVDTFSLILCNSTGSRDVYQQFFADKANTVLPITHAGLRRNTHKRNALTYRIGYFGGTGRHKGYEVFCEAVRKLLHDKNAGLWEAWLYGGEYYAPPLADRRVHFAGYVKAAGNTSFWQGLDIVVVPSQCRETFGFVVLEALANGIPVICSELVGSGYLLSDLHPGLVFRHDDAHELAEKIKMLLDDTVYSSLCGQIDAMDLTLDMEKHVQELMAQYKTLL